MLVEEGIKLESSVFSPLLFLSHLFLPCIPCSAFAPVESLSTVPLSTVYLCRYHCLYPLATPPALAFPLCSGDIPYLAASFATPRPSASFTGNSWVSALTCEPGLRASARLSARGTKPFAGGGCVDAVACANASGF